MEKRRLTYFAADAHLGIDFKDPDGRERRFVEFLRGINPAETEAVYLLGDIFDFWYEYRDVVPKGFSRVFSALIDLMDGGVKVCFFNGNHDIWTYHYLQQLGITVLTQPYVTQIAGRTFCLGHGDGLGPGRHGYKFMRAVFHCRFLQILFSMLHPWIAFRLGTTWSRHRRIGYKTPYVFSGEDEPLYKFCADFAVRQSVDYFVFGHFHCRVDMPVIPRPLSGKSSPAKSSPVSASLSPQPASASQSPQPASAPRLLVLKDWFDSSNYIVFDGADLKFIEK